MHSLAKALISLALLTLHTVRAAEQAPFSLGKIASGCSSESEVASCTNSTPVADLCCFESPGGLLLQTQFWDTNPATGPSDSWTIHGLWPDNCDLTFEENCDPSRAYTDIGGLLSDQGAQDTLDFMNTYWVDIQGKDETFWEHEWSTHGTCYSTLNPDCLPEGSPRGAEAVAFFQMVVNLFQTLPTYKWLEAHEISPSSSATYTLESLVDALSTEAGVTPVLDCRGSTLDSVAWYFHLQGSLLDGNFVPIDAPEQGTCPSSGIKYPPKSESGSDTPRNETPSRHKRRKQHRGESQERNGSIEEL